MTDARGGELREWQEYESARIEMNHRIMEGKENGGLQNLFLRGRAIFFLQTPPEMKAEKGKEEKKIVRQTVETEDVKISNPLCMRIGANWELVPDFLAISQDN